MKKSAILAAFLAVLSCGNPLEPEPVEVPAPALVSTSPADGTGGIEGPSLSIAFTFDQNIVCTSSGVAGISVDGGAFIDKVSPAGAALTVVVSGLARGKHYTVSIPAGAINHLPFLDEGAGPGSGPGKLGVGRFRRQEHGTGLEPGQHAGFK